MKSIKTGMISDRKPNSALRDGENDFVVIYASSEKKVVGQAFNDLRHLSGRRDETTPLYISQETPLCQVVEFNPSYFDAIFHDVLMVLILDTLT